MFGFFRFLGAGGVVKEFVFVVGLGFQDWVNKLLGCFYIIVQGVEGGIIVYIVYNEVFVGVGYFCVGQVGVVEVYYDVFYLEVLFGYFYVKFYG